MACAASILAGVGVQKAVVVRSAAEQEEQIQRLISDKRPEQLKLDFALWTRAAVMLLIGRECGIRLAVRSVGEYLKRWGFTPQKPIRRAYEKSPVAVQKWLDETYPEIQQRAKEEDTEIHWGDETAVVNTDVRGRGYPIVWVRGTAIFQPFAALVLWKHYAGSRLINSGVRKDLWIAFGATIVGGLFLAYFTYWFLSLIRDRKSTDSLMNLHGSAT